MFEWESYIKIDEIAVLSLLILFWCSKQKYNSINVVNLLLADSDTNIETRIKNIMKTDLLSIQPYKF